jgi:hypothetical protein
MNERIFNTSFEVSMRILILLDVFRSGLDEEKILYFDFFTIYEKNYGFGNENINGDSKFMINELTAQRSLINESIKNLVLSNLVKVINTKSGFIYKIHDLGINLSNEMSTDYAIRYKKTARNVMNFAQNMSIREVKRFARNKEEENYNVIY